MATTHPSIPLFLLVCSHFLGSVICQGDPPLVTFGTNGGNIYIDEDTPIGNSLFSISATDDDSSSLTFTTANSETSQLVEIGTPSKPTANSWIVDVTLKASLDRDRDRDGNSNIRELLFKVSDGQNVMTGKVILIISDVNDNPPLFINLPYRITLDEGTAVNQSVFVVEATDPDDGPGGLVLYSMRAHAQGADEKYNNTFVIRNENRGNITLAMELDYEIRNYYQYQVFAKDFGTPQCPGENCKCTNVTEPNVVCEGEPAIFIVTVRDVQDTPPFFENLPYVAEVKEDAVPGTSFFHVSALDGDRGVPNPVSYSIVDGEKFSLYVAAKSPFVMNSSNGAVTVGSAGLDADQPNGRSWTIQVMATEVIAPGQTAGGITSAITRLAIAVHDVNDNAPTFSEPVYYAKVLENTPRGVPLTMTSTIEVQDKDQSENSEFKLSVVKDGQPYNVFQTLPGPTTVIHGLTTVMLSVYDSAVLDYETTKNITFQLKATENSTVEQRSNNATVILIIEDMNDNSPVFPDQARLINVTENTPVGVVLATFTATDADSGVYGNVSYSLEDDLGKFQIDPQSGSLSAKVVLDREAPGGTAYPLVVVATDNMGGDEAQRRSTRLNIRVEVLDINDNAPEFTVHPDTVTVQENASPGETLMTLTATDRDAGLNGQVIYSVLTIQSTYVPLPPAPLFSVHRDTGVVTVGASLIGYPGSFNVTVMASDSAAAGEEKNDTTLLVVNVQDVNINSPVFVDPPQSLVNTTAKLIPNTTVNETQPVGSFVYQFNATDEDTGDNGQLLYKLVPDLDGHFLLFDMDFNTGTLTNAVELDREKFKMLQINVQATDQGVPIPLSNTIPFRVFLQDLDDNDPEFPEPATLTLAVGENLKFISVGFVNISTDKDHDPKNKKACYYIYRGVARINDDCVKVPLRTSSINTPLVTVTGGESLDSFFLNTETGDLRLEKELNRDETPKINLVVKVTKDCDPLENQFFETGANLPYDPDDRSLLQVTVEVEDVNDSPPVFDDDALTVGLLYNEKIGFLVFNLSLYTSDLDTPENSKNEFELLQTLAGGGMAEPDFSPFKVTPQGLVETTRLFSADETGYFELKVRAFDDIGQSEEAMLTIYLVSDLDRVKLVFDRRPNEVQSVKGELVTKLSEALGLTVIADKIATHITAQDTADPRRTDVFIHARKPNGEILTNNELLNAIDFNKEVRQILITFGASESLPVMQKKDDTSSDDLKKAFIIVAIVLSIICVVLFIVLFNTVRRYRRRLRAATTSAFVSQKIEPNNFVPPGTNKYFAAENPLYGKDMKPVDVDRLGSSSDTDSLDDNAVAGEGGGSKPEVPNAETLEEQEMYLELFDEGGPSQGAHLNHLAMVLQEYERENQEGGADEEDQAPYAASSLHGSDNWKTVANGHAKTDSGYTGEHGPGESAEGDGIDRLQHTDI